MHRGSPALSGSKEWPDVRSSPHPPGFEPIVTPIDALMAGFISLLSGTLVILWLADVEQLRLACGVLLGCYLIGVVVATFRVSHRRNRSLSAHSRSVFHGGVRK